MGDGVNSNQKQIAYSRLIEQRKECRLCCDLGLTNPNACSRDIDDQMGHIGAWTQWQGNLDANLMVVGQDWGGTDYYNEHHGQDEDTNPTNKRLRDLLASIGIHIGLPRQQPQGDVLFFTNAILCLRPGRLTGTIKPHWFNNCSKQFLRPQVELVNPKVVVTLGYLAYRSLVKAHDLPPQRRMREAVKQVVPLPRGALLVPVYHPGNNGTRSRTFEEQKLDWQRVRGALDG